jgi:hypothetical protein
MQTTTQLKYDKTTAPCCGASFETRLASYFALFLASFLRSVYDGCPWHDYDARNYSRLHLLRMFLESTSRSKVDVFPLRSDLQRT